MLVTGVWQFSWTVRDLDAAVRFYRDGLGFELRLFQEQNNEYTRKLVGYPDTHIRMAQFNLPGVDPGISGHLIELTQYYAPDADTAQVTETYNPGVAHVALISTDLDAVYQRVIEFGGRPISEPVEIQEGVNKGGRAMYVRDPEGFTLEFVEPPASRLAGMTEGAI